MAVLSPELTQISRPFNTVGVDFAGPFDIKSCIGRICGITKAYVCVFACFSLRAHIRPVYPILFGYALSLCIHNGINFVGAGQLIKEQRQEFLKKLKGLVISTNSFQNLNYHFIPPGAPHRGGQCKELHVSY